MKTKENVNDRRVVKLEKIMDPNYIPFLGGRPARADQINKNDVLDMKIMVNLCGNVEEFIAAM
jgi:hypothetical protein